MSVRLLAPLATAALLIGLAGTGIAAEPARPATGGGRPAIAIPEPELLVLFALGVVGLAAGRRLARRRGGN
ncbi:hypothetical protein ACNI3Q_04455 [Sphingomonas sp. FW199]|uniref:hypothetical protein n=1 Tax=Sphingomonas sp. FW199 TaxID=3400217 RepID=UPI003CF18347